MSERKMGVSSASQTYEYQMVAANEKMRIAFPSEARESTPQIPPRGTEAYAREVVLDAIRTGYEEGYPLRSDDIRNIDRRVRESEGLAPREKSLNVGQLDTIVRREYGFDLGREEEAVNAFRMYYERHVERETGPGREQGEAQGRGR